MIEVNNNNSPNIYYVICLWVNIILVCLFWPIVIITFIVQGINNTSEKNALTIPNIDEDDSDSDYVDEDEDEDEDDSDSDYVDVDDGSDSDDSDSDYVDEDCIDVNEIKNMLNKALYHVNNASNILEKVLLNYK